MISIDGPDERLVSRRGLRHVRLETLDRWVLNEVVEAIRAPDYRNAEPSGFRTFRPTGCGQLGPDQIVTLALREFEAGRITARRVGSSGSTITSSSGELGAAACLILAAVR